MTDSIWEYLEELDRLYKEAEEDLASIAEKTPYAVKLAVTQWVMQKIVEHAKDPGSYRYLIYDRLGFDVDAYIPLANDGLTISNEFDLHMKEEIREALKEKDYEKIKSILGLCEVYGCHKYVSDGWSTKDGVYMRTCGDHYRELQPFMGKTKND
jgi:hypothetical protein